MPRYIRRFYCKSCNSAGSLDNLCEGVSVIECNGCDVSEVWGQTLDEELDHFHTVDEKVAVAAGGWMN